MGRYEYGYVEYEIGYRDSSGVVEVEGVKGINEDGIGTCHSVADLLLFQIWKEYGCTYLEMQDLFLLAFF